jgi:hypothetical protein
LHQTTWFQLFLHQDVPHLYPWNYTHVSCVLIYPPTF